MCISVMCAVVMYAMVMCAIPDENTAVHISLDG